VKGNVRYRSSTLLYLRNRPLPPTPTETKNTSNTNNTNTDQDLNVVVKDSNTKYGKRFKCR